MKTFLNRLLYFWFGFFLVFAVVEAFAQTNGVEILPGDKKVADFFAKLSGWQFLLPPVVAAILQGAKVVFSSIPPKLLPWIGPVLGALLDYAATKAGFWTGNLAVGASMGALATWGHQALIKPFEGDDSTPTLKA